MEKTVQKIAAASGSVLAFAGLGAGTLVAGAATVSPEAAPAPQPAAEVVLAQASPTVRSAEAVGLFAYTQAEVTPIAQIASALADAPDYLCGARSGSLTNVAAEDWLIAVGGDVANPYEVTVAELQADPEVQSVLMGCSCQGNPADGKASVNARVTGVAVNMLLQKAGVEAGANTVVFESADGYEVALPLRYVAQRYCPIVFDVNGSPIAESVGGTNQLWLGSTSARYFARDIVSIRVETRDEMPVAPDATSAANLPNVGVAFGGEVE